MKHAIIENEIPVLYTERFFKDAEGVQYPLRAMDRESKLALGVYEVQEDYTVPDGFRSVGRKLEFDPVVDVVREIPDLEAIPTDDPRPKITAAQIATKADKPTENPDGSWSYKWTVTDKTAEELAQEETNKRQGMTAQRWSFATAVMGEGIITSEEALAWGPGNALPADVDAALVAAISDPRQLAAARVQASAAPRINRLNPLVEILRVAFGLTPEKVDELFQLAKIIEES